MTFRIAVVALALGASAFGMSQKQTVSIRFHPEVNPNDGASFAMPVKLENLRRNAYVSRVPAVNEKMIKAIFPFPADDGTWGCHFQLDAQGKIRLETMSAEQLNTALVLIVSTKLGQHQVTDMLIDRPVTNGTITVPRGFTAAEVVVMKQQFPVIGEEKGKKKAAPEPIPESTPPPAPPPSSTVTRARKAPTSSAASRQDLHDLDLPRLQD